MRVLVFIVGICAIYLLGYLAAINHGVAEDDKNFHQLMEFSRIVKENCK